MLAERRARRGEPIGDPILIRRAETAEATAEALEGRLSDAARELQAVTSRLSGREEELRLVSERLVRREGELSAVSQRLGEREQQLRRAELDIRSRIELLERRVGEVQGELAVERGARERAEQELTQLRGTLRRTEKLVSEVGEIARRLRLAAQAADARAAQPREDEEREQERRAQMTDALATAVERLRARVVAVGELQESAPEAEPAGTPEAGEAFDSREPAADEPPASAYSPPTAAQAQQRPSWLAPAIRRVAQRRDERLAGELVVELLAAQGRILPGRVRYEARITGQGAYEVRVADGSASVTPVRLDDRPDVVLEGPASAFAEVAAGGVAGASRSRRPEGLKLRGGRLRGRRLLAALREPLALADLARGDVAVWPGLLLVALAEAIETGGVGAGKVDIAFEIEGRHRATLLVHAEDGQPLHVARLADAPPDRGEPRVPDVPEQAAAGIAGAGAEARTVVRLSERAFLLMLAGCSLPEGEQVLVQGDPAVLERLLSWADRAQGIRRFDS